MKLRKIFLIFLSSGLLSSHAIAHDSDSAKTQIKSDNVKASTSQYSADANTRVDTSAFNNGLEWSVSQVKFELHGFMTAGMSKSSSESNYNQIGYGDINNSPNFITPTLAGLQLNTTFNDHISIMTQIVVDGDISTGKTAYTPNINWLYIEYKFNPNVAVRVGRFQIPGYLDSQQVQVGYNFPYTYLPNEVYRILPMYSMNGVNLLLSHEIGDSNWSISAEPFFGNSNWKYNVVLQNLKFNVRLSKYTGGSETKVADFTGNNLGGVNVSVQNSFLKFNASYMQTSVSDNMNLVNDDMGRFYSLGVNYNQNNIWLSGEIAKRDLKSPIASLTGFYLSGGYQFGKFLPYINYAKIKTDNTNELNAAITPNTEAEVIQDQQSYTVGLDYYVNTFMVLKGSYTYIVPQNNSYGLFDTKPSGNVSVVTLSTSLIF